MLEEVKQNNFEKTKYETLEEEYGKVNSELEKTKSELDRTNKNLKILREENDFLKMTNEDLQNMETDFKINIKDGKILESLCAFHSELKEIEKSSENPFFNSTYADFSAILKEIRPILSKHNLILIQAPLNGGPGLKVKTLLYHTGGESIEMDCVRFENKNKFDIQQLGGAITYLKRYSVQALLCISFEVDDDGNSVEGTKPAATKSKPKANRF